MGRICWYTNLDTTKRPEPLTLYKRYAPEEYPTYTNYPAIEVAKVAEIPNIRTRTLSSLWSTYM